MQRILRLHAMVPDIDPRGLRNSASYVPYRYVVSAKEFLNILTLSARELGLAAKIYTSAIVSATYMRTAPSSAAARLARTPLPCPAPIEASRESSRNPNIAGQRPLRLAENAMDTTKIRKMLARGNGTISFHLMLIGVPSLR